MQTFKMRREGLVLTYWVEGGVPDAVRHLMSEDVFVKPTLRCPDCRVTTHNEVTGSGQIKLCGRWKCPHRSRNDPMVEIVNYAQRANPPSLGTWTGYGRGLGCILVHPFNNDGGQAAFGTLNHLYISKLN